MKSSSKGAGIFLRLSNASPRPSTYACDALVLSECITFAPVSEKELLSAYDAIRSQIRFK